MSEVSITTVTAGATAPTPRFDFPTWLPPMLVKELRQGLRTRGFVFSLIGLHVVLVIAFAWALVAQIFDRSSALDIVNGFYWTITVLLLGIMLHPFFIVWGNLLVGGKCFVRYLLLILFGLSVSTASASL